MLLEFFLDEILYGVPKHFENEIKGAIRAFIWKGKRAKIKYNTLVGYYLLGGLKLPDFASQLMANKIKQVVDLITNNGIKVSSTNPSSYLDVIGGLKHIHINFDHHRISGFYKDILKCWARDPIEDPSEIKDDHLWNNRYIRIDKKAIFYKEISDLNINKVGDLSRALGHPKS